MGSATKLESFKAIGMISTNTVQCIIGAVVRLIVIHYCIVNLLLARGWGGESDSHS